MWAGAGHPSVVPVKLDALSNLDHLLLPSQQYIFGLDRTPAFVVVQTCWAGNGCLFQGQQPSLPSFFLDSPWIAPWVPCSSVIVPRVAVVDIFEHLWGCPMIFSMKVKLVQVECV
jgi:hypothetical protein